MPKLQHYDDSETIRFITFSCHQRQPNLNDDRAKQILIEQLNKSREKYGLKIFAFVIMPEHVHLVLWAPGGIKLGKIIGEIKSLTARKYFALDGSQEPGQRKFWQKRCYDHNCRSLTAVEEKIRYCHENPAKRGLINGAGDYRWSSFSWSNGKENTLLKIDDDFLSM